MKKFSSHRKCKGKWFGYKSTIWCEYSPKIEERIIKSFVLQNKALTQKEGRVLTHSEGSGLFFKHVMETMWKACSKMWNTWNPSISNLPENPEWVWFCEIFGWKVVFSKQCFHRTFSNLCECQCGYLPREQIPSKRKTSVSSISI